MNSQEPGHDFLSLDSSGGDVDVSRTPANRLRGARRTARSVRTVPEKLEVENHRDDHTLDFNLRDLLGNKLINQ